MSVIKKDVVVDAKFEVPILLDTFFYCFEYTLPVSMFQADRAPSSCSDFSAESGDENEARRRGTIDCFTTFIARERVASGRFASCRKKFWMLLLAQPLLFVHCWLWSSSSSVIVHRFRSCPALSANDYGRRVRWPISESFHPVPTIGIRTFRDRSKTSCMLLFSLQFDGIC
jgi:hypothetical protein